MSLDDPEELKDKQICFHCVGEPYLKEQIRAANDVATCSYCGTKAASFDLDELSGRVHEAFEEHYERTATEPDSFEYAMMNDKESTYTWERQGEPVMYAIMNAADIPEAAAEDIQAILQDEHSTFDDSAIGEETEYDSDSHYEEKAPNSGTWQLEWDLFSHSLRTEARFFSHDAEALLTSIFTGVEALQTKNGDPVLVKAGPETKLLALYRARVFQSEKKLAEALKDLALELGSPPTDLAIAGRMNARGISTFYGATNAGTALAEIRPPVGSHVVSGQFTIVRPILLLDLAALGDIRVTGSIFDPRFGKEWERAVFFRLLGEHMTRPVMPDDEALDYLTTQAVADFLASNASVPIDGIIYRSAQTPNDERNVVLFHKAARVERFARPYGTEVDASLGHWEEEGWETGYEVIESVPPADAKQPPNSLAVMNRVLQQIDTDSREIALRLEKESLTVHEIIAVTFKSSASKVRHFTWEKRDDMPF